MIDYLAWRGEFPFAVTPWCAVDGVLMATVSYLNFHGIEDAKGWTFSEAERIGLLRDDSEASSSFENRSRAFRAMAESVRFRDCRMHHFIAISDAEKKIQFSAMCIDLPDGTMCVAFRGTDNTIVGWREDFDMAYQVRVPAQEAAVYYLAQAAECTDRPLRVVGHSKGGNLAVYAAALADADVQDRIVAVESFDGPGMNREMAQEEGYLRLKPKIRSYIPQSSIIGLLMEYYEPYTVVKSTASGITQHDPMTWQVYGPRFEEMEGIDHMAEVVRDTLHEWLEQSTPEQRGAFVEALFQMVDATKATRFSDLTGEKLRSLLTMVGNRKDVEPETRRVFNRLMAQAVTLGFGNVVDLGKSILKRADAPSHGEEKPAVPAAEAPEGEKEPPDMGPGENRAAEAATDPRE